ncbi:hypothetical protein [Parafrankia sp. FMc2]|uniref:hypothetical protein n=1 Tax=Parafrankia sp. FMc2 TaxID=3233196 RepID=UPI0034D7A3AB
MWQSESGSEVGSFVADARPDSLTASGVLEIAQHLSTAENDEAGWAHVVPLIKDLRERLESEPLELRAHEQIGHLRSVCWDPADQLVLIDELMPVPRARRIAPQAVRHLSHHSEHWRSRTLEGIRPARILASRPEDDIDRYENRVAARLVLNLLYHVRTRLAEARKLDAHMATIADAQLAYRPSWRNADRLARLLGRMFDDSSPLHGKAADLIDLLRTLERELTMLLGSPVLSELSDVPVSPGLRPTNLFTNDHRYRQVRDLWEQWIATHNSTDVDRTDYHQQFCHAFERYALLVVLWASQFLGMRIATGQAYAPGATLTLTGHPAGDHLLRLNPDATFTLSRSGVPVLRIIPLAHALTGTSSAEVVERCVAAVEDAVAQSATPTLVLYPGSQEERDPLPPRLRARVHVTTSPASLAPISPAELDSIERVARALRWHIDGGLLLSYPPRRPTSIYAGSATSSGWLNQRDRELRALRPPANTEWTNSLAALRESIRDSSRRHDDNTATQLLPLVNELRDAITTFTHCPICRQSIATHDFVARNNETFWARCTDCNIDWGLRQCACGGRYPVLSSRTDRDRRPDRDDIDRTDRDRLPELDRIYGNELLAEPCRRPTPGQLPSFICTSCRTCTARHDC